MTPITFTTSSGPGIKTTVELSFTQVATGIEITATILSGGGRIKGIFGEIANNDIDNLGIAGSNVRRSEFNVDHIDRLGNANVVSTGKFDYGVEFHPFSHRVTFVLTGATLADLSKQKFAISLQGNKGNSKLTAIAPEIGAVELGIATAFSGTFVDLFALDVDGVSPFLFEDKYVAEPVVGSSLYQSIVVTNSGALDATNVLVTADFIHPFLTLNGVTGTSFINLDTDGDPLTGDGNPLTGEFLITSLAAGASTTITVGFQVNDNYGIFVLNESVTTVPGSNDYDGVTFSGKVYTDAVEFTKAASSSEIIFNPFPQLLNAPTASGSGDTATTEGQLVFLRAVLEGQLNNGATAELKSPYAQLFDLDPLRRAPYPTNNSSDLIGPGQTGIIEITSTFNLDNVDPLKLAAFESVGASNPLNPNGAISLFRELVQEGAYDPDAFVDEFKGTSSSFVVTTYDRNSNNEVTQTNLAIDSAEIENVTPPASLTELRFELKKDSLQMRALIDGDVEGTAHARQNGHAPDVLPFKIFALDSPDSHPLVDRTWTDQGEGIGIRDGDDGNSSLRKRIDGDEILGIDWVGYQAARAFIDVERVSSHDGAKIRVEVLNGDDLVDSQIYDLGLGSNQTGSLALFSTGGLFDEVRISAADLDTTFTFRGMTLEAVPV